MKLVAIIIALLCSLWGIYFNANKSEEFSNHYRLIESPPFVDSPQKFIDIFTLGHRSVYDDFLDIWLLQILADPKLKLENVEELFKVVLSILNQKPKIETMYMLPCFIFVLDFQRPEMCEKVTLLGLEVFPQSWRIPMTQGYVYAFKLNNPIKASAFYNLAASRKDSPPYVASLAKKLLLKDGNNDEIIKETMELMFNVPGGSKFTDFVANTLKNKEPKKEEGK